MAEDAGLTHIALVARDLDASIAFYGRYARIRVVHERQDADGRIAWLGNPARSFVVVLAQGPALEHPLGPFGHLGVACVTREEVDRLCDLARAEGCLVSGPQDSGYPVGYWAFLRDPDGHTLELSFGQEIGRAVKSAGPDWADVAAPELEYPPDETDEG